MTFVSRPEIDKFTLTYYITNSHRLAESFFFVDRMVTNKKLLACIDDCFAGPHESYPLARVDYKGINIRCTKV